MENILNKDIMAIVPEYVEGRGNCTKIYAMDMEPVILDKSIKTIIRLIGKHYMIDLGELKKRYRNLISSPNLVPIPLSKRDIFIPFKTRVPMYKNDGAFGYINMKYIEKIKEEKGSTVVYLSNGTKIPCLCSLSTIDKHMKNGNIVSRCYEDRAKRLNEEETVYTAKVIITR
ncbi:competence protein ComK [Tissierella sp.]|uniref:competence protein ComK n=1 Tax=Tissierella sp. TaxID=41274 RepID=UPI0028AC0BF4|nr:competence protein ComK [Tissierella sp.]